MMRAVDKWLAGYVRSVMRRPPMPPGLKHLVFCVADHFEPGRGGVPRAEATGRVRRWVEAYPASCAGFRDADGQPPRHTFFYPQEEYDPECLDLLAGLCRKGFGEVEVHLHHRNDTPEGLREKLTEFRDTLRNQHGLLGVDAGGRVRYGFVHGNWALCNSRPDGDWCGVNEEIRVLVETGCYADFTFPSAPSPTQPRMVNVIYRAADAPGRPRGHDRGREVASGGVLGGGEEGKAERDSRASGAAEGDLMLITGPLALNWRLRKWGILPRLENGAIEGGNLPENRRIDLWVKQHIHVAGRPDWVFVKVYTHGCHGQNPGMWLGPLLRSAHEHLMSRYNDGVNWRLHFASAREMFNIIRAAESGATGDPGEYRDWEVKSGKP